MLRRSRETGFIFGQPPLQSGKIRDHRKRTAVRIEQGQALTRIAPESV
jgi:hypothetical protein